MIVDADDDKMNADASMINASMCASERMRVHVCVQWCACLCMRVTDD